jgi:RNA polymerase sigma-70 factor (ECF subfamily)
MPNARGEHWLQEHGDYLYRYALVRVRCSATAEDLVQQTLLAGLQADFGGRSEERTWLTGILRNKIFDLARRGPATEDVDAWLDEQYDRTGHWRRPPGRWGADPSAELERREFWEAFEVCRDGLPERLRIVFSMRFVDDEPTAAVCEALAISSANLWTLIHRARVRLWNCLDRKGLVGSRPREKQ